MWQRREFLASAFAGLIPAQERHEEAAELLAAVARRYRGLHAFSLRVEATLYGQIGGPGDSRWSVTLAVRSPEIRYEITMPLGTLTCWTDSRSVRWYETSRRRFFESEVGAEGARTVVLPALEKAQRIYCTRFASLDQAQPLSRSAKSGSTKIAETSTACHRVVVRASELVARANGTEEIWISDSSGFVVRSDVREVYPGSSSARKYLWTEFSTDSPTDEQVEFAIPQGAIRSDRPVMVGR